MFLKKAACLLLTLVFISIAVPAFADGNPPPTTGDENIHPWDNNDGANWTKGPHIVQVGWMWLGYTPKTGLIVVLPRTDVSRTKTTSGSKSDKQIRIDSGALVVTRNR